MSSVHLPRAMTARSSRTQMDLERENFEKIQATSLQKAINSQETPVKEKHVRRAIMGSHQDRGAGLFWNVVLSFQLQGNPITCWKFCHVLHKLMRDGHQNSVAESFRYCSFLTDLGKLWGHLKDHHGRLIAHYTNLLVQKLSFHHKYPEIPGSFLIEDAVLEKICNNDINAYFEMSVDMLDYMDDILLLQGAVFGSLDMSRANSMTPVGQCRLAPLIPCIQDSCQLYDFLVKILFKLHSSLSPDTLNGHRDRFHKQYKNLKRFYFNSANLQYFKNLIRVPVLPEEPPNFLVASNLSSHVTPEAVVEEPEPEPEPELVTTGNTALLIDTNDTGQENGAQSPPQPDERDVMIQQLMAEVTRLREEIRRLGAEEQMMTESLNNRILELEAELSELKQIAESTQEENEDLRNVLKEGEKNHAAAARLGAMEKIAKSNEDKFKKIKEMYTRIKEEHVSLLRSHADVNKSLAQEKKAKDTLEEEHKTLQDEVIELQREKSVVEANLQQNSATSAAELTAVSGAKEQLEQERQFREQIQALESQLKEMTSENERNLEEHKSLLEKQQDALKQIQTVETELDKVRAEKENLSTNLNSQQEHSKQADDAIQNLKSELEASQGREKSVSSQLQDTCKHRDELLGQKTELDGRLSALEESRSQLETSLSEVRDTQARTQEELLESRTNSARTEEALRQELQEYRKKILMGAVEEGELIIRDALSQTESSHMSGLTCTAEYLMERVNPLLQSITLLRDSVASYTQNPDELEALVKSIVDFSHRMGDAVITGFATAQSASIDEGEALSTECKACGETSLVLLKTVKQESSSKVPEEAERVCEMVRGILERAEALLPKVEDIKAEQMGDLIDQEMQQTTDAIEKAAAKISAMLSQSREKFTGIQLEVNESILDSCNGLMRAIMKLVERSKVMQREIVAQGRPWGASSAKDFYKKHHRWTEGLISAAKAVGWGANVLVDAADRTIRGEAKFEELMVCSQEIAASTTQLVIASKVKANRGSENLAALSEASKAVTQSTAHVVASAKSGIDATEEMDAMDFSKLTLHQSKRMEMESQVKVLTLESDLEKERRRLAELRKTHYALAAESEGCEQET